MISLPALRQLASPRSEPPAESRCEVCSAPITEPHRHLVEVEQRGVLCACHACAVLFNQADPHVRFRTVPDRVLTDPAFAMTTKRWTELGMPVGLAFFVRRSAAADVVCCFPGPAGITEADVAAGTWDAIADATPLAGKLIDDAEVLLVHGERGAPTLRCFLVPITAAYDLAGRLRRCWKGFTGGDEARHELATFFAELERKGGRR